MLATDCEDSGGDDVDDESSSDGEPRAFAGASKRPASVVLDELDARGAIDADALWDQMEELAGQAMRALQPDLAFKYRRKFPSDRRETLAEAARVGKDAPEANDLRCFHVVGVDVLIDEKARPRLIELNASPSLSIDQEVEVADALGNVSYSKEPSPVDVAVKTRVVSSMLRLVAEGAADDELRPICGRGAPRAAREWTLLDRCRRLFGAALARPEKGMGAAHWVRFCRSAGILSGELRGFVKADLEIMHTKYCGMQSWKANEPAQKVMRWATFARALRDLAERCFDDGPARSLERLLDHIARNAVDEG